MGGKLPSLDRILEDREIVALLRKLPDSGLSPVVQAALLIVLSTGCRLGEICKAQWTHVQDGIWVIPPGNAKNRKEHRIALSPFAGAQFDVLASVRESGWCLPSPRKIGSPQTRLSISAAIYDRQTQGPQRQGRTAATSALLLDGGEWTVHDLRRSCASGMQRLGVMPAVIDAVLNHKESKGVTQIYQRYDYSREAAEAWAKWSRHLAGLLATAQGKNVVPINA
ncbi:site-specific integrase [Acidithiobacillus sp. M4-SHS-6]|uniref:site-specific integrase n=1 Tax=Acidithiobacillus sp. M4-SHS-6 TaxID=3383024 RepID=UPI0039BDB22E